LTGIRRLRVKIVGARPRGEKIPHAKTQRRQEKVATPTPTLPPLRGREFIGVANFIEKILLFIWLVDKFEENCASITVDRQCGYKRGCLSG
jgi:hypothetical protein